MTAFAQQIKLEKFVNLSHDFDLSPLYRSVYDSFSFVGEHEDPSLADEDASKDFIFFMLSTILNFVKNRFSTSLAAYGNLSQIRALKHHSFSGSVINGKSLVPDIVIRSIDREGNPYYLMCVEVKANNYACKAAFAQGAAYTQQAFVLNDDNCMMYGLCTNGNECHLLSYDREQGHRFSKGFLLVPLVVEAYDEWLRECQTGIQVIFTALCERFKITLPETMV